MSTSCSHKIRLLKRAFTWLRLVRAMVLHSNRVVDLYRRHHREASCRSNQSTSLTRRRRWASAPPTHNRVSEDSSSMPTQITSSSTRSQKTRTILSVSCPTNKWLSTEMFKWPATISQSGRSHASSSSPYCCCVRRSSTRRLMRSAGSTPNSFIMTRSKCKRYRSTGTRITSRKRSRKFFRILSTRSTASANKGRIKNNKMKSRRSSKPWKMKFGTWKTLMKERRCQAKSNNRLRATNRWSKTLKWRRTILSSARMSGLLAA